jgi:hypothetical protein
MAVSETDLAELAARVERLEQVVAKLQAAKSAPGTAPAAEPRSEKERLLALLQATGLLVKPGPLVRARAEAWRRLPEQDRRQFRQEMDALQLDRPLSQIIIDSRRRGPSS